MKNKERAAFFLAAMKALHWSERVLAFHHVLPDQPPPMDCDPHIQAMAHLCREQQLDDDAIKYLRKLKTIIGEVRGQVALDRLRGGQESAAKYGQWLSLTFPEAFERTRKHGLN